MKKATLGLSILLCAGALTHALGGYYYVSESDRWQSYHGMSGLPLNSSQPITVKITGPTDSQGYPTGEIYYNDVFACGTSYYRYFPSFVSRVEGQGWSPDFGDEFIPTSLIQDDNVGYDYGWVTSGAASSTLRGWVDGGAITFYGGCGSHKLGVSIKDVLTIVKNGRARLTIDRLLYSSTNLANMHDGSPMWVGDVWDNWDRYRMSRAYYYLYLTISTRYDGYTCENNTCTKNATNTYNLTKGGKLDFSFEEFAQSYATVRVYDQRRHYTLSNGKYVAGDWATTTVGSCYGSYESGTRTKCNSLRDVAITWDNSVHKGDSLVEFRRMWVTTIATGQSNSGAHAMEVYDTTYSDIIKLVPKYKIVIGTTEWGNLTYPIDGFYEAGRIFLAEATAKNGHRFKCWSTNEAGTNCVSTTNPLWVTARGDTSLYAIYEQKPYEVTLQADAATQEKYSNYLYQYVLGRDNFNFVGNLSGPNQKGYFALEYNDYGGWTRIGDVNTIEASVLGAGKQVNLKVTKDGYVGLYNGTTRLARQKIPNENVSSYRLVLSYDPNMASSSCRYSEQVTIRWSRQIAFYGYDLGLIRDTLQTYGTTVKFPTDRALLRIPEDGPDVRYEYYWIDQDRKTYKSSTTEIEMTKDSLILNMQLYAMYRVQFVDYDGSVVKDTMVRENLYSPVPELPAHKGLEFKGWNPEANSSGNITGIMEPTTVKAVYEAKAMPEYAFTVSGFGYGSKEEDIQVTGPNDCFDVSPALYRGEVGGELTKVNAVEMSTKHYVQLTASVICDDDSLGNIWEYLANDNPEEISATVNGKEVESHSGYVYYYLYSVSFWGLDGKVIGRQMVEEGESATPPKAPEEKGYVFTGWDSDDYKKVTDSRTIHAEYEKVESSSSAEGKSSSSKGKTGIVPVGHAPQFSLVAVGRNIQVSGATVGSAYAVFDMQGRVLKQGRVESSNFDMSSANAGTYLVRIAGQTATVRLR